jgi:hypothetical protein
MAIFRPYTFAFEKQIVTQRSEPFMVPVELPALVELPLAILFIVKQ